MSDGDDEEEPSYGRTILTRRLRLRPHEPADRAAIAALTANPAIAENLCSRVVVDAASKSAAFVVVKRSDGAVIGGAWFGPDADARSSAELTAWIGEPFWGLGYGTEAAQAVIDRAFGEPGIVRLWCAIRVTNRRGRRVVEKCGFQFRGTGMVRSHFGFGAFPVERFALDRADWSSLKAWGAERQPGAGVESRHETAA
ncbi:MAG: GNAT family N-acetyltransferase [Bauldia sp.]